MTSYMERMAHDPALRAFVEAERGRCAVELAALKVELEHARDVIAAQAAKLKALEPAKKSRGKV